MASSMLYADRESPDSRAEFGQARIRSAAFSPISTLGAWVCPRMMVGITDASATRRPCDAANTQLRIHHAGVVAAHPAGADRVIKRCASRC